MYAHGDYARFPRTRVARVSKVVGRGANREIGGVAGSYTGPSSQKRRGDIEALQVRRGGVMVEEVGRPQGRRDGKRTVLKECWRDLDVLGGQEATEWLSPNPGEKAREKREDEGGRVSLARASLDGPIREREVVGGTTSGEKRR